MAVHLRDADQHFRPAVHLFPLHHRRLSHHVDRHRMQTEKFGQESESLEDDDANIINNDIVNVNINERFKTVKFGFSFNFLHFSDSTKASNL